MFGKINQEEISHELEIEASSTGGHEVSIDVKKTQYLEHIDARCV